MAVFAAARRIGDTKCAPRRHHPALTPPLCSRERFLPATKPRCYLDYDRRCFRESSPSGARLLSHGAVQVIQAASLCIGAPRVGCAMGYSRFASCGRGSSRWRRMPAVRAARTAPSRCANAHVVEGRWWGWNGGPYDVIWSTGAATSCPSIVRAPGEGGRWSASAAAGRSPRIFPHVTENQRPRHFDARRLCSRVLRDPHLLFDPGRGLRHLYRTCR